MQFKIFVFILMKENFYDIFTLQAEVKKQQIPANKQTKKAP